MYFPLTLIHIDVQHLNHKYPKRLQDLFFSIDYFYPGVIFMNVCVGRRMIAVSVFIRFKFNKYKQIKDQSNLAAELNDSTTVIKVRSQQHQYSTAVLQTRERSSNIMFTNAQRIQDFAFQHLLATIL